MKRINFLVFNFIIAGNIWIKDWTHLFFTLLSLTLSIRVFAGKWQLIRNKLEELHSGLNAAENSDSGENLSLSRLVTSIGVSAPYLSP